MTPILLAAALLSAMSNLPALIPEPTSVTPLAGSYVIPESPTLSAQAGEGRRMADAVFAAMGVRPKVVEGRADLTFRIDAVVPSEEGYRLDVGADGVRVLAASPKGWFWAVQTLAQLKQGGSFPAVRIEDSPRFAWRGVMVDESRHFIGMPTIKRLLDVMAATKLNVLHWHLTDDQGWRIAIAKYPRLTEVGAWRKEPDGSRHGGFYTPKQIREVVAYAAKRNIEVVPEIEMPGHCTAALAAYPDLGCRRASLEVPTSWGIFTDVFCAGREETFRFLDDVLDEVADLFPSKYLHIGGDECPKTRWSECPDCQRRMQTEGLKNPEELQSWFVRRAQASLAERGKTLIGWDEILEGGLAPGAVVQVWQDIQRAFPAYEQGAPLILSPSSHLYLNRDAGTLSMERVYSFLPEPAGLPRDAQILGIESPLWAERITKDNLLPKFLPRGLAVAELAWANPKKDYPAFAAKVRAHLPRLEAMGLPYGAFDRSLSQFTVRPNPDGGGILTAEAGPPEAEIRGTLDGRAPTGKSPLLGKETAFPVGSRVRAAAFYRGKRIDEPFAIDTVAHLAVGASVRLEHGPEPRYAAGGPGSLTDGLMGSNNFSDGLWLGFEGVDLVADVDLGRTVEVREVALRCFQQVKSWIVMPRRVEVETSLDGGRWEALGRIEVEPTVTSDHIATRWFAVRGRRPVLARHIRVRAANYGPLPAGHLGAGSPAFLFADELAVR